VALLLTLGAGWYVADYRPQHQTILTVGGTKFDVGYLSKMLKLYGSGQSLDYVYYLASQMPGVIEQSELVKQGSSKMGVSVSDAEVKADLASNNLTNDYWDIVKARLLVNKVDDYFNSQVPSSAEQRDVMARFLESQTQASDVRARLDKGEDFAALASQLSMESTSKEQSGDMGWHPKGVLTSTLGNSVLDDYAFTADKGSVSQPLEDANQTKGIGYWLVEVVKDSTNTDPAKVHVWQMLLGSAEQAQTIKASLEKGEDFATLAKEFSQDSNVQTNGGDLGLVTKDQLSLPVADYAFGSTTQQGKISDPLPDDTTSTTGGYWLVKVVDIDGN
jgi:parvulin-like peptidyl-prolyl isomerase